VRDVFAAALNQLDREVIQGLRVKLRLTGAPELGNWPWEYLYHNGTFIALSTFTPITRYVDLPRPVARLAVAPPLRLVVMASAPTDNYGPRLDVDRERAIIATALADLERHGLMTVEWLPVATLDALQARLRKREPVHLLHFSGHGRWNEQEQDGELVLQDDQGRGQPVSARHLATLLQDHRLLRLVLLNACEGARHSAVDPYAGAAGTLVRHRVPAVVAMQFAISDEAAIILAREFYGALADGYPVDAALAEARKAIFARVRDVEFGTPVLYLRAENGRLFDLPIRQAAEEEEPRQAVSRQAAEAVAPKHAKKTPIQRTRQKPARRNAADVEETALERADAKTAKPLLLPPRPDLSSPDFIRWAAAVEALAMQGTAAVEPLVALLGDMYPQVRMAAIRGLERVQPSGEWRARLVYECYVPAGKFVMGDDRRGQRDERPAHEVWLEAFYAGKYPVTNADWKRYMDDIGKAWQIPKGKDNHPVVNVNWLDAWDYAAWAGMRLLTEAEWAKAASWDGTRRRVYPWGNAFDKHRCNTSESGIGATTPVGVYSTSGDSPYGCTDMAGNVWEWTGSLYQSYPYRADDGREDQGDSGVRVVRGGSFNNDALHARTAYRGYSSQDKQRSDFGFRCGTSPV
jgi:hypothetical protein